MTHTPTLAVSFSGEATIRQAEEIARRLKEALASSDRIEIDCSAVTEVDLSFVQLILAMRKSAELAGKTVRLSAPASGPLLETAQILGAQNGPRARFWLEGEAS